jgi:hypothetical protein
LDGSARYGVGGYNNDHQHHAKGRWRYQHQRCQFSRCWGYQSSPNHDKRLATQIARAALVGVVLIPATDDFDRQVFIVSRWALTTQLDSLDAVTLWLDRVTGKKTEVDHAV